MTLTMDPIVAKRPAALEPIVPTSRWRMVGRPPVLTKTFIFAIDELRNEFLLGLVSLETETGHSCEFACRMGEVTVSLLTADIETITELDREFAKSCDVLYREISYNSLNACAGSTV